jgi:cytoskeletal protein RodZ
MSEQDFYQVLELAYDASSDDVRSAYERLRQLFEVDAVAAYTLFGADESSHVRERLDQAFAVLSDDEKREEYDAEIGNGENAREDDARDAPSLSHTATFDAHSEMTVSVAEHTTEPPREQAPAEEAPADEAAVATAAVATPEAPAPSAPEVKTNSGENTAGLADTHEDGQYSGGVLQRLREGKSLTIEDIAKKTKISLTHLRAIEGNAYDKLPARVYVRGFVSQYARCLGLHPDRIADSYLHIYDRYFQTKN